MGEPTMGIQETLHPFSKVDSDVVVRATLFPVDTSTQIGKSHLDKAQPRWAAGL